MSTRAPSIGRGCRAQRGGVGFLFAAKPPPFCLPHRGRGTAPAVDRVLPLMAYLRRSLFHLYRLLETIFSALFHTAPALSAPSGHLPLEGKAWCGNTAIPIQPPPLRGTSFHRKEGVSTRAPSLGRGEGRSEAGLAFFLRRSRLLFAFPIGEGGPRQRWIGYSRISPA